MKRQLSKRISRKVIAAAVGAVGLMSVNTQQANAGLMIDVTAVAVTGGAVINDSKSVTFTAVGQTVTLNLTAQIRGTNSVAEETIQIADGSILTTGPLLGNLSFGGTRMDVDQFGDDITVASNRADPFDANGSVDGDFTDLDGDGDIDVGSTGSNTNLYFVARSASPTAGSNVGAGSPGAGDNRLIGFVKFTYTGGGNSSLANFRVRTDAANNPFFSAALWFEDGSGPTAAKTPTSGSYSAGLPVALFVPEPSGVALAASTAIGLVGRRRNRVAGESLDPAST